MYIGHFLLAKVEHSCPIAISTPFYQWYSECMYVGNIAPQEDIHQQVSILLLSGTVLWSLPGWSAAPGAPPAGLPDPWWKPRCSGRVQVGLWWMFQLLLSLVPGTLLCFSLCWWSIQERIQLPCCISTWKHGSLTFCSLSKSFVLSGSSVS